MATWKQIEQRREARLWLTQVILPTAAVVGGALAIPEVREKANAALTKVKTKVKGVWDKTFNKE